MKTSELTGAALDWAVAKCEESDAMCFVVGCRLPSGGAYVGGGLESAVFVHDYTPSTDWAQGGPIIEREEIAVVPRDWGKGTEYAWGARLWLTNTTEEGPTPLIAAMRCYVASKLGDDVEIPEKLA